MTVQDVLAALRANDIKLLACGERLIVDAPADGVSTEIRTLLVTYKSELMAELSARAALYRRPASSLANYAADRAPMIRCTLRETRDLERDITLLHRLRHAVEQHPPGGNRVFVRLVSVDGPAQRIEWRALATRDLRRALARVLAETALEDIANSSAHADDVDARSGQGARTSPALRAYAKIRPRSVA